ncbi:MAG: zinc-ribbon domain-containing protein [Coprococcus phoceensis]
MRYCVKCGRQVEDSMNFCPSCGAQIPKEETHHTYEYGNGQYTQNP